jgi:hypothetical protein
MKCVLFEITYLRNPGNIWADANDFLTTIKANSPQTTSFDVLPSYVTVKSADEAPMVSFCFADGEKINCVYFYKGISFDLTEMNAQNDYFTFFHEFKLSWKVKGDSDVSVISKKILNPESIFNKLYATVWADYLPVDYVDVFDKDISNTITYSSLDEMDSTFNSTECQNKYENMVCECHKDIDFTNVHHCFNVDHLKNWSLIKDTVKTHLTNSETEHTDSYIMENDLI